jgi:anti-sigma-K factor RskA
LETTKYIESGILELYVFGKLSASEEKEVLENAAQYPEIKAELTRIEITFEQYAMSRGITPPAGTLTNILRETGISSSIPNSKSTPAEANTGSNLLNYLLAALTAVSLLGAYYFHGQANDKNNKITSKTEELAQLKTDCDKVKSVNSQLQEKINIISNVNNKDIIMGATGKYENTPAVASVYYNTNDQVAWLDVKTLPAPPTGKQYQLWAIVDGKPVDMGVFDLTIDKDTTLQTVPYIAEAQAFAVTIEDAGGVENPTLEEMIVVGTVG